VLIGLSTGVLTAIQLYFATWVIGTITAVFFYILGRDQVWRRAVKSSLKVGIAALIGFFIVTLPIFKLYPIFVDWVVGIITHQGHYGGGEPGFVTLQLLISNFVELWKQLPLLFILTIIVLGTLLLIFIKSRRSFKQNIGLWAAVFGLTIQLIVTLGLILKHPSVIYMQAVAAILPILITGVFVLSTSTHPKYLSEQRLLKFGLSILIFAGFFFNLYRAALIRQFVSQQYLEVATNIDIFLEEYAKENQTDPQKLSVLWIYGMPSDCFARWYGNSYAGYGLAEEISAICPGDYMLDVWENLVHLPDGNLVHPNQYDWDIIVAMETALIEFPYLKDYGNLTYAGLSLPSYGKVVYITSLDE